MFKQIAATTKFSELETRVLEFWESNDIFKKSVNGQQGKPDYTFYEGPPTANGKPGIHHVFSRTIKDLICRYKTMQGYQVHRKAGWDTHGLPVEIEVERQLGLKRKEDIETYGVDLFNEACRNSVFEYKSIWEDLTLRMGYWVDMSKPYITCENNYIESVWWALDSFFKNGLIYRGFKVQLYCPRCGTPLSSHEVSQGYRDVDDPSIYVKAPVIGQKGTFFLVWTTTPWTLISNVALAVAPDVRYVKVRTGDEYLILAEDRLSHLGDEVEFVESFSGADLIGWQYEPWFDYFPVDEKAWYVIGASFVTTTEGSGIVHMAPAYGEDDYQASRNHDLPMIHAVDPTGHFRPEAGPFSGKFFKEADSAITQQLKHRGLLHLKETYRHSYPHCWRCDTPLIFYARQSWYIRTTDYASEMIKSNTNIDWHPPEVGVGRFGNWLEENKDWAISRDRYWGTPIPIWTCDTCDKHRSIGSIAELQREGSSLPVPLDLHKPHIDQVTLACNCGGTMHRIPEVVDCWFDSGSMPFAQWHYPFENEEIFNRFFPADFICEGVDQTRGWFYSLHAINSYLFKQPCFKNVIVNELVLDKRGLKMSKSRGNTIDPFELINQYGADSLRWFLIVSSPPGKTKLFDEIAVADVRRKLFSTVLNTYSFFALYANIDGFTHTEADIPISERADIDKWVLSVLNSTARRYVEAMDGYDPTRAARLVSNFTIEELSNWYVRRNRRRFWKSESNSDKIAAYQTLFECLTGIVKMIAPIAPFLADEIYRNLMETTGKEPHASIHVASMVEIKTEMIDEELELMMTVAQRVVSIVRGMRTKNNLKVRQPLSRIAIPVSDDIRALIDQSRNIILEEINVKTIEFIDDNSPLVQKRAIPNFRRLGPRFGKEVNEIAKRIRSMTSEEIVKLETDGSLETQIRKAQVVIELDDVTIEASDVDGWMVDSLGGLTVALDIGLTPDLIDEGLAREFINRVQKMRKEAGLQVTDRIQVGIKANDKLTNAIYNLSDYVMKETLAVRIDGEHINPAHNTVWEIDGNNCEIGISKASS